MSEQKQEVVKTAEQQAFELVQKEAKALASSQLIPANFRGKVDDCIIAIEMAKRIGAAPLAVLQNIYIVHGKPSWASQFIIGAINSCGRFKPLKFKYNDDYTACFAYTSYSDEPGNIKGPTITMSMADAEGWTKKNGSKWKTMPELMLSYRAATFFGRLYCPDLLMGMKTSDELEDIKANDEEMEAPPQEAPKFRIEDILNAFKNAPDLKTLDEKYNKAMTTDFKDDPRVKEEYMKHKAQLSNV